MVEPKVGMRVTWTSSDAHGILGTVAHTGGSMYLVQWDDGIYRGMLDTQFAWKDGNVRPIDEQPKPLEPWAPKVGEAVVFRGVISSAQDGFSYPVEVQNSDGDPCWFRVKDILPATAPPLAISKRDTLPAPPSCPHCADNAGMLDAACKRLGDREVEHAAALRELTRITAEFRAYRKAHR